MVNNSNQLVMDKTMDRMVLMVSSKVQDPQVLEVVAKLLVLEVNNKAMVNNNSNHLVELRLVSITSSQMSDSQHD